MGKVCPAVCLNHGAPSCVNVLAPMERFVLLSLLFVPRSNGEADTPDRGKRCRTEEGCRWTGRFPPVASDRIGDDEGDAAPEIKDGKAGAAQI